MHSIHVFGLALLLVAPLAVSAPVVGAGDPANGTTELFLRPLWTVGQEDVLLGRVGEVLVDDDGTIFVLDGQLAEIHVLSPEGEWLRTIGRQGEGPGEFREPTDMFLTHDGKVAVVQQQPAKVALIDKDGTALDDMAVPDANDGFRLLFFGDAHAAGSVLTVTTLEPRDDGSMGTRSFLIAIDAAGDRIGQFLELEGGIDFAEMQAPETHFDNASMRWAVTSDDRVAAVTAFDTFAVDVFELDGTLAHRIRRDELVRPRTQEEIDAVAEDYQVVINDRPIEILTEENARMVQAVVARPDGILWTVRRGLPEAEREAGRVMRLDEFGPDGDYQRHIVVRGEADPGAAQILIRGDRVFVVEEGGPDDEVAEVTLTCFAMEPSAGR